MWVSQSPSHLLLLVLREGVVESKTRGGKPSEPNQAQNPVRAAAPVKPVGGSETVREPWSRLEGWDSGGGMRFLPLGHLGRQGRNSFLLNKG